MSGISFSLKGKNTAKNPKSRSAKEVPGSSDSPSTKVAFSLGGKKNNGREKKNLLGTDSDSDDEKITAIDTFTGSTEQPQPKNLVIRPQNLNKTLIKPRFSMRATGGGNEPDKATGASEGTPEPEGHRVISMSEQDNSDPEEDMDSYKDVAVEEFGAALLKGMGWKRKKTDAVAKPQTNLEKRKQGMLLGIGAKSVQDNDLAQELLSSKAKFTIPVVRKEKRNND